MILLEVGFLSSESDLAHLLDADWRQTMARAIRDGLADWAEADAGEGPAVTAFHQRHTALSSAALSRRFCGARVIVLTLGPCQWLYR